jgi:cell wall-associated NlpC family hydrolase
MTNKELVLFAKSKLGTPYVYGMKGDVLTEKKYEQLKILFGELVWDSDRQKIGQVCVDCSGLISWATGIVRNSQGYHDTAEKVFPISTVNQAPVGAAVWCKGHIGIYMGGGKYIAADGSAYGVRMAAIQDSKCALSDTVSILLIAKTMGQRLACSC